MRSGEEHGDALEQGGQEQQGFLQVAPGADANENTSLQQGLNVAENEISGGTHGLTIQGGNYKHCIQNQVNNTFHADAGTVKTGPPLISGAFPICNHISVLEGKPIGRFSHMFHGILHSDVIGDKKIAVKITRDDEIHRRKAKIYFLVPQHENIVERILTDTFEFRRQPSLYIAMERCDCNLYDHVKSEKRNEIPFDLQKYLQIVHQIVVALHFLHSHSIVHGDLNPYNVLLILNGNIVKLSDFGFSRAVSDDDDDDDDGSSNQRTSSELSAEGWLAPEVLKGVKRIALESDIFPLGLVCHYAWSYGKHPYGDIPYSRDHFIAEGTHPNLEGMRIPNADSAKDLLKLMLRQNSADRPTTKEVLEHETFASQRLTCLNRVNNAQLEEVVDKAFRTVPRIGASEGDNEVHHFGFTVTQLSNAIKRVRGQSIPEPGGLPEDSLHQPSNPAATTQPKQLLDERRLPSLTDAARMLPLVVPGDGSTPVPLCEYSCNFLLLSDDQTDMQLLRGLASLVYGRRRCNGDSEFLQCDLESCPSEIQKRFSYMATCKEGITQIVIASGWATTTLSKAAAEKSLRKFLHKEGLRDGDLNKRLAAIRRNLAVFTLAPYKFITQDSAKIAVNIWLGRKNSESGKLITERREDRKFVNEVTFHDENCDPSLPIDISLFIKNAEVMKFVKQSLRRHHPVEYCQSCQYY